MFKAGKHGVCQWPHILGRKLYVLVEGYGADGEDFCQCKFASRVQDVSHNTSVIADVPCSASVVPVRRGVKAAPRE